MYVFDLYVASINLTVLRLWIYVYNVGEKLHYSATQSVVNRVHITPCGICFALFLW